MTLYNSNMASHKIIWYIQFNPIHLLQVQKKVTPHTLGHPHRNSTACPICPFTENSQVRANLSSTQDIPKNLKVFRSPTMLWHHSGTRPLAIRKRNSEWLIASIRGFNGQRCSFPQNSRWDRGLQGWRKFPTTHYQYSSKFQKHRSQFGKTFHMQRIQRISSSWIVGGTRSSASEFQWNTINIWTHHP